MTLGTLLTLFVVPAVYSYLGQRHAADPQTTHAPLGGHAQPAE